MFNRYQQAKFTISAAKIAQLPPDIGREVAFAGRSNAGKSSAINSLTHQRNLARTSKTPGRTQLINFFQIDDERRLVDLPGYGYAKVAERVKLNWQQTLEDYLRVRQSLVGLVLLMDIRHPLKEFDRQMLTWCAQSKMPVHVLLTKSDKLKRGAANTALLAAQRFLNELGSEGSVQLFSSLNNTGVEQLIGILDRWLETNETG